MHTQHSTTDGSGAVLTERTFGPDDGEPELSTVVAAAVADAAGVETTDLEPLYSSGIDPDALNTLFDRGGDGATLSFEYAGYQVRVRATGHVSVWEV